MVASLFLTGWALDQIVDTSMEEGAPGEFNLYQQVLRGMAQQLDDVDSTQLIDQTAKLAEQYAFAINLEQSANLALPAELNDEFEQTNMLALQSETETNFLFKLQSHPEYFLQLSLPVAEHQGKYLDFFLTLTLYLGITLALVIWLVPLTSRLSMLNKVAANFGHGQLDARIAPSRLSYISGLENSFNRMATQIEKLVADNKLLAGSLSHDLRTPVACLRFGIEAAIDAQDQQQKDHYLQRLEEELSRMEVMLEAFLEFASMERQSMLLKPGKHEINSLVTGLLNEMQPLADKRGIKLSPLPWTSPVTVVIDQHWFYRALMNLISNALDYSQTSIVVENLVKEEQLILRVHDDGPGVPDDQKDTIFDAFVTMDETRNRQSTNFGLGLAIVQRVIAWHGGKVRVLDSDKLGGACFELAIPFASPLSTSPDSPN